MIYRVRLSKKVRNIKVYRLLKRSGQSQNFITKLFMKVFSRKTEGAKG